MKVVNRIYVLLLSSQLLYIISAFRLGFPDADDGNIDSGISSRSCRGEVCRVFHARSQNSPSISVPIEFGSVNRLNHSNPKPISFGNQPPVIPAVNDNSEIESTKDDVSEIINDSSKDVSEITNDSSRNDNSQNEPIANDTVLASNATDNESVKDLESSSVDTFPGTEITGNESNSDSFLFPGVVRVNLVDEQVNNTPIKPGDNNCGLDQGNVEVNGSCVQFLARNGCPDGEWFVANSETGGECVSTPCPFGQLFYNGKCVNPIDDSVCREGQMLYVDYTGLAHCDCQPKFIYDAWSGRCFAQGDQGNCNFGEHLFIAEDGTVMCIPNKCLLDGFVYHTETGRCYKKVYRGFCDEELLIVHPTNMTAECGAIAQHSIFDLPTMRSCPGGSIRDYRGRCSAPYRVPSVSSYPSLFGGCPIGFTKDSRGTCRKMSKLLG